MSSRKKEKRALAFRLLDVPCEALDIGGIEKAVLLQLLQCWNPKKNGNIVWPSKATIAIRAGFSERTVFRALTALEGCELIKKRASTGRLSNRYSILIDVIESRLEAQPCQRVMVNHDTVTRLTMSERPTNSLSKSLVKSLRGSTTQVPVCESGIRPIAEILKQLQ